MYAEIIADFYQFFAGIKQNTIASQLRAKAIHMRT